MPCIATPNQVPSFDVENLLQQLAGDRELMRLILETFRSEWPRRLAGIRATLEGGDQSALIRHAHTLKGNARQLSAAEAAAASARVEHLARSGALCSGSPDLDQLEATLRRLDQDILRELGSS